MIKPVVWWPQDVLMNRPQPVTAFGDALRPLLDDMRETMIEEKGVGIAANQIGVALRIAIVAPEEQDAFIVANPEWIERSGAVTLDEGCLSVPDEWEKVPRFEKVKLRYQDEHGATRELEASGRVAHVLQHEIDHLDGLVFVDRLSSLKKSLIRQRMVKRQKQRVREAKRPKEKASE